jgi:hypothetical protein
MQELIQRLAKLRAEEKELTAEIKSMAIAYYQETREKKFVRGVVIKVFNREPRAQIASDLDKTLE